MRSVVIRRRGGCSLRRDVASSHSTIDNEVCAVDEAALIAGKEEHALGLLNGLTEATGREMDFATSALGLVVAKPVLKKRGARVVSEPLSSRWRYLLERSWAQSIKPITLPSVANGQLSGQR